jgi:hypothetical protein
MLIGGLELEGGVVGEDLVVLQRQQSELQQLVLNELLSEHRQRDLLMAEREGEGGSVRKGAGREVAKGGETVEEDLSRGSVKELVIQSETEIAQLDLHNRFISAVVRFLVSVEEQTTVSQGTVEIRVTVAL